ncbi:MAG: serine--tRNA ligase [Terriglobales bacterium]
MLDSNLIRQHPEQVREMLRRRGASADLDHLLTMDADRRAAIAALDELRHQRKTSSEAFGRQIRQPGGSKDPEAAAAHREAARELGARIAEIEAQAREREQAFQELALTLPNSPHASVPPGRTAEDNLEVRRWGTPRAFDFPPRDHVALGADLGILDLEAAAKISGARFAVYRGLGARLERALAGFMLDLHAARGYTEILPPALVSGASLRGTGQLPKFAADLFRCEGHDLWLIPTAEVPLTNLFAGETLDAAQLPARVMAHTSCFRSEAGSYGKDTRGIIRQHQFQKVELVQIAAPEHSYEQLEQLAGDAEAVLQALELPYRVMALCAGDLGFSAAKTYDLEVWLPSQNAYREISSCSNFEAFQARRANIRYRPAGGGKAELAHTLNGSGLAVGRTWVAVIENYQQPDGSVVIPAALRPYLGGLETIAAEAVKPGTGT